MNGRETSTNKNVSLQAFRIQLYAAWSCGVARVGWRLIASWKGSWNDTDARATATKRFAKERTRVQQICDEMVDITDDGSATRLPMYESEKQALWLDKDVRERLLNLNETPARVWFDSKRQFANHLREGATALLTSDLAEQRLFDEDREQLATYGYEETSFTPGDFTVTAGAELTKIQRTELVDIEMSDAGENPDADDVEKSDQITEPPLGVEQHGEPPPPLLQAMQLLELLKQTAGDHLVSARYVDGYGFRYDVIRGICTGFFQQRIGEFAADVERLQRAGELVRRVHQVRPRNLQKGTLLLANGPGAVLQEFTEWLCTNGAGVDIETRDELLDDALSLYLHRGWHHMAVQLIRLVSKADNKLANNIWLMLQRLVVESADGKDARDRFQRVSHSILASRDETGQEKDVAALVQDAMLQYIFSGQTFLLADLALVCHQLHLTNELRKVLSRALPRLDDDDLRTIRPIIPRDLAHLAAEYPQRNIPTEWISTGQLLIIDPDLSLRVLLSAVFRRLYYEVSLASSKADGIAQLTETPDIILLADVMPDGTCVDVIEHIQRERPSLLQRILILASCNEVPALFGGRLHVLKKPFDLDQFVGLVRSLPQHVGKVPPGNALRELRKRLEGLAEERYATVSVAGAKQTT